LLNRARGGIRLPTLEKTKAVLSADGKHYSITGQKCGFQKTGFL